MLGVTRIEARSKITTEAIREGSQIIRLAVGTSHKDQVITDLIEMVVAAMVIGSHLNSSSRMAVGREMPMLIMVTVVLLERRRRYQ